jgi:hypothetical protein
MLANASGFVNGILQTPSVKNGDKAGNHYPKAKTLSNGSTNVRVRNTFLEPVLIEEETLSVSERAMTEPGQRRRPHSTYSQSDAGLETPAYVAVRPDDRQRDVRWVSLGNVRNFNRQKIAIAEALAEQEQLDRLGDPEVAKEALRERFPLQSAQSQADGSSTSLKSIGTALHPSNCTECHFHAFKPGGCRAGKDCNFCHELHPRRNPRKNRRFMRRILGREAGSGTTTTTYQPTDENTDDSSPMSTPRSNERSNDPVISDAEAAAPVNLAGVNIPDSMPKNLDVTSKPPGLLELPQAADQANLAELNMRSSVQNSAKELSKPPGSLGLPQAVDHAMEPNMRGSMQNSALELSKPPGSLGLGIQPPLTEQVMPKEASFHGSLPQDIAKSTATEPGANSNLISLKYTSDQPRASAASNGNATPPVLNLVAGVKVVLPAIVDIAPEKQDALSGYLEFSVSPPLPQGLNLDSHTGFITGIAYIVQEAPTVHQITISVDAFGRGGVRLMMLPITSCQLALRIVDLQNYTISWVQDADESDEILLKLQKS